MLTFTFSLGGFFVGIMNRINNAGHGLHQIVDCSDRNRSDDRSTMEHLNRRLIYFNNETET